MRYLGRGDEFDLTADKHQEFSEWAWVSIDELTELIVPFKRGVYEQIVLELGPLAKPA